MLKKKFNNTFEVNAGVSQDSVVGRYSTFIIIPHQIEKHVISVM